MRLVMVVPHFPRLSETFIASKFVGLVDAGWDVHVVCQQAVFDDWDKFTVLAPRPELKARVHQQPEHSSRVTVGAMWLPNFLSTWSRAPQTTRDYLRAAWQRFRFGAFKHLYLDSAIIALSPDIVHFEFGSGAVGRTYLKSFLGCYLSASFRGYDLAYSGLENSDHYRLLWENADSIHVLGNELWQRAIRRGCPPDMPHAIIPPAIDSSFFVSDEMACAPAAIDRERPLRILSVGRLEWVKGYEYGLEAVRYLREDGVPFEYHIIGSGSYLEPLAFARHQLGLEEAVQFLGGLAHPEVMEEMKWADVFLHSAVSEGFCNAVLEAQAMRLPVVCSDAGGLKENVVDGETGFIVPRRDPAALAEKLAQLARNPEQRWAMGNAGRQRVQQCFQTTEQIAAFDRFYRAMAGENAR